MADLFEQTSAPKAAPLADRMRPTTIEEVVGHNKILAERGVLAAALAQDDFPSLIFWGPPGSGKTTLARVVASRAEAHFEPFSAVLGGVKEVRVIVARAKERRRAIGRRTLLFVDEIHRFNKSQQDAFLPHVEDGTLILIGATTENPSFTLNAALLSRGRVVKLEPLAPEALTELLKRAMSDGERGLGSLSVALSDEVLEALAHAAGGDARRALNDLELVAGYVAKTGASVEPDGLRDILGRRTLRHDRAGDAHYDIASAFIKSLRGSDPDAALYYMARLIEAGDDPRFICRRMVIFASEDIGNADPRALTVAVECMQAYQMIGMPEGRILMGQACTYLATAPKSNASYVAINNAMATVRQTGSLEVPDHIRNAPTKLAKSMGHGAGYRYPHDYGGWVPDHYLPESLRGRVFYEPSDNGYDRHLKERLTGWRQARDKGDKP